MYMQQLKLRLLQEEGEEEEGAQVVGEIMLQELMSKLEEEYIGSVIPNDFLTTTGGGHGITIGREIQVFASASDILTEVLCNCFV